MFFPVIGTLNLLNKSYHTLNFDTKIFYQSEMVLIIRRTYTEVIQFVPSVLFPLHFPENSFTKRENNTQYKKLS